jgi:hypothetical protein
MPSATSRAKLGPDSAATRCPPARLLAQNPAHRLAGFKFDALGDADKNARMPFQLHRDVAEKLRRNRHHQNSRSADGLFKIRFRFPIRRQLHAGQQTVRCGPAGARRAVSRVDVPERDGVAVFVQDFGQRRAPRAGAENGDFHFVFLFFAEAVFRSRHEPLDVGFVFVNRQRAERRGDDAEQQLCGVITQTARQRHRRRNGTHRNIARHSMRQNENASAISSAHGASAR